MAEALQVVSLDGLFACTVYSHARHSLISFAADTVFLLYLAVYSGGQRKSFLQLAIWASWRKHLLAQTSFQLAPKAFWRAELISQFFLSLNSSKIITCPSGKLRTEFTSPIAKSTSPGLSDTTFFARWYCKTGSDLPHTDALNCQNFSYPRGSKFCTHRFVKIVKVVLTPEVQKFCTHILRSFLVTKICHFNLIHVIVYL